MNHWLVYWKTYWDEIGSASEIAPDWHSSYDTLYENSEIGDYFWVVVSGGPNNEGDWRLLEKFVLQSKHTIGGSSPEYRYEFLGHSSRHEVYDPDSPNDLSVILTSLEFATDHPIRASGRQIGQSLQSPRLLTTLDAKKLQIYSEGLPRIRKENGKLA